MTCVWALVPVKSSRTAKSRLAGVLAPHERAELQHAMLRDVVTRLRPSSYLAGVAVVSPDPVIVAIAGRLGAYSIGDEPVAGGLNAALRHGSQRLRAIGAELIAILPGDVPLLNALEIDHAIRTALQDNRPVLVPDRRRRGTNAMVFWAHRRPRFAYGSGSFGRHLAGFGAGSAEVLELPSLARDVDWPNDLAALRRIPDSCQPDHTSSVLKGFTDQPVRHLTEMPH